MRYCDRTIGIAIYCLPDDNTNTTIRDLIYFHFFELPSDLERIRQIFITEAVHKEVVTEGIALGKTDAFLMEEVIGDSDRCHKSRRVTRVEFAAGTGYTIVEAESILLARELDADLLLINERDGRRAAKNAGVKVKGVIGVISDCIERDILTVGAAVEILIVFRDNPSEFRIDPDIIDIAIKRMKNLSNGSN
ncbi:MAG: hypothetical protein C5S48_04130 [Candidatus Methanogaster sp.]|nr:MAG: hypothetical protein C5S48_04130 [ANME-2 cluster archaeon]